MKNADAMTPAELRALAEEKENESRVVKTAVLKHDLYYVGEYEVRFDIPDCFLTDEGIENIKNQVEQLKQSPIIPKGTVFSCYLSYGQESWCDALGEVEGKDEYWAAKHLEDIAPAQCFTQ